MDLLIKGDEVDWGVEAVTQDAAAAAAAAVEADESDVTEADARRLDLVDRAQHMNQTLQALGFTTLPLDKVFYTDGVLDVIQTLVTQRKGDMARLDDFRSSRRKLDADMHRLAQAKSSLASKCRVLQREVEAGRVQLQREKRKHEAGRRASDEACCALEKRIATLEKRDVSYVAKLRKHEANYDKLRTRLRKVLVAGNTRGKAKIPPARIQGTMLGKVVRARAPRSLSKENVGHNYAVVTRSIADLSVVHLEEELMALRSENNEFRNICSDLQECVLDCSRRVEQMERVRLCSNLGGSKLGGRNAHAKVSYSDNEALPLEWIRLSAVGDMKAKVSELKDRIASLGAFEEVKVAEEGNEDDVFSALAEAREIIREQDALIRQQLMQRRRARKILAERREMHRRRLGRRRSFGEGRLLSSGSNSSFDDHEAGLVTLTGSLSLATPSGQVNLISLEMLSIEHEMLEQEKSWLKQERESLETSKRVYEKERLKFQEFIAIHA